MNRSGFTPPGIADFRRMLRGRGSSLELLAAEIGTTRSYLSRVLWDDVESADTRKRLHAVTTADEWAALCTLEHFATWNKAQDAAEATAAAGEYVWLTRSECAHCHGDRRFKPACKAMARGVTHGICDVCFPKLYPGFARAVAQPHAA